MAKCAESVIRISTQGERIPHSTPRYITFIQHHASKKLITLYDSRRCNGRETTQKSRKVQLSNDFISSDSIAHKWKRRKTDIICMVDGNWCCCILVSLSRIGIRKVRTDGFLLLISLQPSSNDPSSVQLSQTSKEWLANTNSVFLLIC